MRIALFSETFIPQRNGVAILLGRFIQYLARHGHEVLVVTSDIGLGADAHATLPSSVKLLKVPGFRLPRYPDLTMPLPFAPRVARALTAFRPDIVHLVTEYTLGVTGLSLARKLGVPVLASFETNVPGCLPYYGFGWASELTWRYLRWFHNRSGLTLCPSEPWQDLLRSRGFRHVRVWVRGVDTEQFTPTHRSEQGRRRNGPPDSIQLLYVGRLTPEKELPVLFQAYQQAASQCPDQRLHLVLAGDGAYAGRMRNQAPPGVTFVGYVEGQDLSEVFAAADVFVLPSRVETLGYVVLEAMASGLPVVGADRGGTLENVRDGINGLLCPAGDTERFAQAIRTLVSDVPLRQRLAQNARAWAAERTWNQAFGKLVGTYEERISGETGRVSGAM
jgi:phosphatidylinositol alpha 1,6-mannosyltransferase